MVAMIPEGKHAIIFKGLGKMQNIYKIRLLDNGKPYSLTALRRILVRLREKVKKDRMLNEQIIEVIDEPTERRAPFLVVKKNRTDVRICVDVIELKNFILRERRILPMLEEGLEFAENSSKTFRLKTIRLKI